MFPCGVCRVTSLTRKRTPLGPHRRPMPRVLWGSQGGGCFLMSEKPLYSMGAVSLSSDGKAPIPYGGEFLKWNSRRDLPAGVLYCQLLAVLLGGNRQFNHSDFFLIRRRYVGVYSPPKGIEAFPFQTRPKAPTPCLNKTLTRMRFVAS